MKDPKEVKILAIKGAKKRGLLPSDDRIGDSGTTPGRNSPDEVRSAQRNLVACGLDAGLIQVEGYDEYTLEVIEVDQVMKDIRDMITPNTAYVTGPMSMSERQGTVGWGNNK